MGTRAKTITRNAGYILFSKIVPNGIAFLYTILVTRYLGAELFGKLSFALAFVTLFGVLSEFGLTSLIIRDVARDRGLASKYLGNAIVLKIILALIAFVLLGLTINFMGYPKDTVLIVYIIGFTLVLNGIGNVHEAVFNAFERMEYQAVLAVLVKLISVSIGLAVIFMNYGLFGIVCVIPLASSINVAVGAGIIARKFFKFNIKLDVQFCKNLMVAAMPFMIITVFSTIYLKIDTVMLSIFQGDTPVGWYNSAYNIVIAISYFPAAFVGAIYPVLSKLAKSSPDLLKQTYRRAFRYLLIFALPMAVGVSLLAEQGILMLYGKEFLPAVIALQILIWAEVPNFINALFAIILRAIDKQKILAYVAGAGAALNIALNLFLIPRYGLAGAGYATALSYGLAFLGSYFYISKYLCRVFLGGDIVKVLTASCVMGAAILFLRKFGLLITIPSAMLIYFTILVLIKGFSFEELRFFGGKI